MWVWPRLRKPTHPTRTVSLGLASALERSAMPAEIAEPKKYRRSIPDSVVLFADIAEFARLKYSKWNERRFYGFLCDLWRLGDWRVLRKLRRAGEQRLRTGCWRPARSGSPGAACRGRGSSHAKDEPAGLGSGDRPGAVQIGRAHV